MWLDAGLCGGGLVLLFAAHLADRPQRAPVTLLLRAPAQTPGWPAHGAGHSALVLLPKAVEA